MPPRDPSLDALIAQRGTAQNLGNSRGPRLATSGGMRRRGGPTGGWSGEHILVDLDGTLAYHDGWVAHAHVGEPVQQMVDLVKRWLSDGHDVRIFTARVSVDEPERSEIISAINAWSLKHIGQPLPVTNKKDLGTVAIYDDIARQVQKNSGRILELADILMASLAATPKAEQND